MGSLRDLLSLGAVAALFAAVGGAIQILHLLAGVAS
jgi:hypothetical protein